MFLFAIITLPSAARGQSSDDFDKCGFLVQGQNCVVFESGGSYILSDYGRFVVGDFVRVTGTLDEDCVTICDDVDGCIRGATIYDALVIPCGTELPTPEGFAADLCAAASGALVASLFTLRFAARRTLACRSPRPGCVQLPASEAP